MNAIIREGGCDIMTTNDGWSIAESTTRRNTGSGQGAVGTIWIATAKSASTVCGEDDVTGRRGWSTYRACIGDGDCAGGGGIGNNKDEWTVTADGGGGGPSVCNDVEGSASAAVMC